MTVEEFLEEAHEIAAIEALVATRRALLEREAPAIIAIGSADDEIDVAQIATLMGKGLSISTFETSSPVTNEEDIAENSAEHKAAVLANLTLKRKGVALAIGVMSSAATGNPTAAIGALLSALAS